MKFRVTIEQFVVEPGCQVCDDEIQSYWKQIKQQEIQIHIAEKAAREIERLIRDEGLDINSNDLRKILFEELHERSDDASVG